MEKFNDLNIENDIIAQATGPLTMNKVVDKAQGVVGETLTYTITITNPTTSGINTSPIAFQDTIPTGTVYSPGTLLVDGTPNTGDVQDGITLSGLAPGASHQIIFKVLVTTFPNGLIKNDATINYTWGNGGIFPNQGGNVGQAQTVPGPDVNGRVVLIKSTNKTVAIVGEEVIYTLVASNIGSITTTNVTITDTIPQGTSYVSNSTTINNGAPQNTNPQNGINIGTLTSGQSTTVVFKVKVETIPNPNPFFNQGILGFQFNNGIQTVSGSGLTGNVFTTVTAPSGGTGNISINKSTNKTTATINETITYTVVLTNNGTLPYANLYFVDTIPNGTTFVNGSVNVNGTNQPSFNPQTGFNITPPLQIGGMATITFSIQATTIPTPNPIVNVANGIFQTSSGGGSNLSNAVNTTITTPASGSANITKSVDKTNAFVGEQITYTAVIRNNGNLPLTNVIFTDTIQASGVTFVSNSVTVNGTVNSGNPSSGITIPSMTIGEIVTVVFKVTVNSTPTPNPIPNVNSIQYTYTPNGSPSVIATTISNNVNTLVSVPTGIGSATITKAVDKAIANVGDQLTYTSVITNTGSLPLTNVIFTDTIQANGVTFVAGSVLVNGASNTGDPSTGINIGAIPVGSSANIIFRVTVTTIPVPNPIPNISSTSFTYTPSGGTAQNGNANSNVVNTSIPVTTIPSTGSASIVKTVDKTTANVGETVTYTSVIRNTGSLPLTNVIFTDTLQASNVTFNPNSVTVNGATNTGNPSSGINVGNIAVGQSTTVIFSITISTIPVPNPIPNTSSTSFTYTPSGGTAQNGSANSNLVNTNVPVPTIPSTGSASLNKQVDKATANVGDTLNYVVAVSNTGTIALTNVIFTDTLQASGISFIPGSLTVNALPNAGDPSNGVNIGNIPVGGTILVAYRVKIDGTPVPNPIPNVSKVDYTYTPTGGTPQTGMNVSNNVTTQVSGGGGGIGSATIVKTVDKTTANVGETVTYTSVIRNTGSLPLTNVIFTDTLQASNITFNPNSVTVNGNANTGNPSSGINVGNIAVEQSTTVIFSITINTIPVPNPIPNTSSTSFTYTPSGGTAQNGSANSNLVNTNVPVPTIPSTGSASLNKQVDKATANVGDTLNYVVAVSNTGTTALTNVIFTDTLQASGISFVPGSLTVNGLPNAGAPSNGVNIGNIPVGGTILVAYRVKIDGTPVPNPIPNVSKVDYTYTLTGGTPQTGMNVSNTVTTQVSGGGGTGSATIVKSVDKTTANVGDEINYVSIITNTGTTPLTNVIFTDTLEASGINFIQGSVSVNGTPNPLVNPTTGINIPNIPINGFAVVSFRVKINQMPVPNPIPNKSKVDYIYTTQGGVSQTGASISNLVNTVVPNIPSGKPITSVTKEVSTPISDIGGELTYTIKFTNTGQVATNNVIINDAVPQDTVFVVGSVVVNGLPRPIDNPNIGILVGMVNPGQTVIMTYKVKLVNGKLPVPNPVTNIANVGYIYKPTPMSLDISESVESNQVSTNVNGALIKPGTDINPGIVKSVDKAISSVGDTLTYTVTLRNTGNISTETSILRDIIPNGTSYIQGSLTVDGQSVLGDLNSGVNVGILLPNTTKTVIFRVRVDRIPNPNPIPNKADLNYTYKPNPNGSPVSNTTTSNIVNTLVGENPIKPSEGVIKTADKTYAKLNDIITYTVNAKNTGTVDALNVVFRDMAPAGTSFIQNSVTVNGVSRQGANPELGVPLGNLSPNSNVIVTFKVLVTKIPLVNPIKNIGEVNYEYKPMPTSPLKPVTVTSNEVPTQINYGNISPINGGLIKSVDKVYASVGDTLTYTISLRNTGNVPVNNVVLRDTIPKGTSFILGSVTVNGIQNILAIPNIGIPIGTINPGQNIVILFKVRVTEIPTVNPIPNEALVNYNYTLNPSNPNGQTESNTSNTVTTAVNGAVIEPGTGLLKEVDKAFSSIGEIVTYTIKINNTGNVDALNVLFKDTIPNGTSYVLNSLTVDGGIIPNANPENGVNVGTIIPNGTKVVRFNVKITSIPVPNPIPNKGNINYEYIKNPITGEKGGGTTESNTVTTKVNMAIIDPNKGDLTKFVDNASANLGDVLTYTIRVRNSGNTDATNVIFKDTLSNSLQLVNNSLTVNGNIVQGATLTSGVSLGTIKPNETKVVVFKATVVKIPTTNPILNEGIVDFSYIVNPSTGTTSTNTSVSNKVPTTVNVATFKPELGGIIKSVDKDYVQLGETITYTIKLLNKGNTPANNAVFTDLLQDGLSFIKGSVKVNGVPNNGNPMQGISIGTIRQGEGALIEFKCIVIKIPVPNPILNKGTIKYTYTVDQNNPNGAKGEDTSNTVSTRVNSADITAQSGGLIKQVDKAYTDVGEVLTYTIRVKNNGNVDATKVVIKDTVPEGTSFIQGSVTVNGREIQSGNLEVGIPLGTLKPGDSIAISYKAKVVKMPNQNPIPNTASANYAFVVSPEKIVNKEDITNTVLTKVNSPNINVENGSVYKSVNKEFAKVSEELIYTIFVENKGNAPANDVVIFDSIPEGTEFIINSVVINDIKNIGANPSLGINVGSINPGGNIELIYKVKVITIPKVNPIPNIASVKYSFTKNPTNPNGERKEVITNIVYTKVNDGSITFDNGGIVKKVDKEYADVGETITYTITLKNPGNVDANNIIFKDTIPNGTSFVQDSLRINGNPSKENPQSGVLVGTLLPNETKIISFRVLVTKALNPNLIQNKGNINYTFTKNPSFPNEESEYEESNLVKTVINTASMSSEDGGLIKERDKEFAKIGDTITYTVRIKNTGNILAENVKFVDTIPNGTIFVIGSLSIDGTNMPSSVPNVPVDLGNLNIGITKVVSFKVLILSLPNPNPIPNKGNISYSYLVDPSTGRYNSKENTTNTVLTKVNSGIIDLINGDVQKLVDKNYADLNEDITYKIVIRNSGNVEATNILVKDTIPNYTTFINGSVYLDNELLSNGNVEDGIIINKILPNETRTVTFKVKVTSIPNPNRITNSASLSYSFIVNPIDQSEERKYINTNIVTTTINNGEINLNNGGLLKTVDKMYAKPGEELAYTIKVKNTGNVKVNNVLLTDTPPDYTSFVNSSILVDGASRVGDNIVSGVSLGTLNVGEERLVSYRVIINSSFKGSEIKNKARINYSYTVDESKPNGVSKEAESNTVITTVSYADISGLTGGASKSVDKLYTDLNEELLYTITIKNKGNVDATNVVIKDTIPKNTSLVLNSVLINNVAVFGADPTRGINVGILKPNEIANVSFRVLVTSIPMNKLIENDGVISYNYTKTPIDPNGESGGTITNIVKTEVKVGEITPGKNPVGPNGTILPPTGGFTKTVDKAFVKLNDIVTYTFKVTNSGNIEVNDIYLTDLIPKGMEFVKESFSVDGVIDKTINGTRSVNIGSIDSLKSKIVSFKVKVVSVPENNIIENKGLLEYSYVVDKNKPPVKKEVESNIAKITVTSAEISNANGGLIKQVDKEFVGINEELTYTIKVENTGNTKANNVVLIDSIPEGCEFVQGSVIVDGVSDKTLNPQTGIGLLVLDKGETNIISFKVKVLKLNKDLKIKNNANIYYDFIVDPNELPIRVNNVSNTVTTKENSAIFEGAGFTKDISTKYANIGEKITYTFNIENKGNIIATNVVFKDTIADGLSFIQGSVRVNDIDLVSVNPTDGISLGSITPNKAITLTFKVKVMDLPSNNPVINVGKLTYAHQINPLENPVISTINSNKQEVYIKDPSLKVIKSADYKDYVVSDIIDFKVELLNTGNIDILEARLIDSLDSSLSFIKGSIQVNKVARPDDNITSGIMINNIKAKSKVIVTFKAKVINLPKDKLIKNTAKVIYSYSLNPNDKPIGEEALSNEVILHIESASLSIEKATDTTLAKLDDIITYKVKIKNTGSLKALNVIFIDSIPNEVEFVEGSFKVNGREINSINARNGVSLGDLDVEATFNIEYKVKVIKLCCKGHIKNFAYTRFEYKVLENSPIRFQTGEGVSNIIRGQSPNFRQMNIDGMIKLNEGMPVIEEVNEVTAEIIISNSYVIETAKGLSNENAKLTGYKLVINGYIVERVEYTALNTSQSNHYTCNTKKFSSFIILQEDYNRGGKIEIRPFIEDILFDKIGNCSIYTNITFNLEATVSC